MRTRLEVSAPDGLPEITTGSDLAALIAGSTDSRRRRHRRHHQQGGQQGRGPRPQRQPGGRPRRGDAARRRPPRPDRDRPQPARPDDGGGGHRRVQRRGRLDRAAAARPRRQRPDAAGRLHELTGATSASIVTDTAGRAWRDGQTDIAIGAAGLRVAEDYAGRVDAYGNDLVVTLPAVADEIAGAADLAQGKLDARPSPSCAAAPTSCCPRTTTGPGRARWSAPRASTSSRTAPARPSSAALAGAEDDRAPFGAPVELDELLAAIGRVHAGGGVEIAASTTDDLRRTTSRSPEAERAAIAALCFAHGWRLLAWQRGVSGVVAQVSPTSP